MEFLVEESNLLTSPFITQGQGCFLLAGTGKHLHPTQIPKIGTWRRRTLHPETPTLIFQPCTLVKEPPRHITLAAFSGHRLP
jgi:hypothetical protein